MDYRILPDLNEAEAYASLFSALSEADIRKHGFGIQTILGATMLRCDAVSGSLIVNRVIGLGVAEAASEAAFETLGHFYSGHAAPIGVEVNPHAKPTELLEWLRARRVRKAFPVQVLYRNAEPATFNYPSWNRATGLRLECVAGESIQDLYAVTCENFRMPEVVAVLLAAAARCRGWRQWVVWDADRVVAGSLSFINGERCWLGWTSVLPSHRGRWVHSAIVSAQIDDALKAGCAWITTETAYSTEQKPDAAYFNLRKFGFADAYLRPVYVGRISQ